MIEFKVKSLSIRQRQDYSHQIWYIQILVLTFLTLHTPIIHPRMWAHKVT